MTKNYILLTLILLSGILCFGQKDALALKDLVGRLKEDTRGPYKDIRWFCPDGTNVPAKERCTDPGGYQRARYKDEIDALWKSNKLYLGQILMGTDNEDFLDQNNLNSRMKQYILEHFLYSIDNGWIQRKSQFYRGAVQAEDEESWGRAFLEWVLEKSRFSKENYFLMRELAKYLPHGEESNILSDIRALSKNVADRRSSFMDIRTKIHGNLQKSDIILVKTFIEEKAGNYSAQDRNELSQLVNQMEKYFNTPLSDQVRNYLKNIKSDSKARSELQYFLTFNTSSNDAEKLIRTADILRLIKERIHSDISGKERMNWMGISIVLEQNLLAALTEYTPGRLDLEMEKTCYLADVLCSTGYIYDWELDQLMSAYTSIGEENIDFENLYGMYRNVLRSINWGSAMIYAEFGKDLETFSSFEPLSEGFMDDRIRSSVLLFLGQQASLYNEYIVKTAGWKNTLFGETSSAIQGINPGFAKGKIKCLDQWNGEGELDPKAIYVFRKSPPDLEPVAGILSISEGNVVSHLQLLARNLGIPNANITEELYNKLKKYNDEEVFYAVSNGGGVILKQADKLDKDEKALFQSKTVDEEIIKVPTDQLELEDVRVFALDEVDASSSGILCGPKAANFARLKRIFPNHLVDGLIIPFSVFRDHMNQQIPGQNISYWDHLSETFDKVSEEKQKSAPESEIEKYTLSRLEELRVLIKGMALKQVFVQDMEQKFQSIFKAPLGQVPVFLRSDTNMEDLKDFTGAGLNLTIFNTIEREKILQGIKDVWASPYTERSYRWRQKFLTNPEDVYPSILVIPSVFVEYSGVVITKDFIDGVPGRYNVAFSQGAGGAVDGQKSESWILSPNGMNILVSPARDRLYKYLSTKGGTANGVTQLSERILTVDNIADIWRVCYTIHHEMPSAGMSPPYDIELGFENSKLWLFQIRPFVENKKAVASNYLKSLDPVIPKQLKISLNDHITQ